MTPLQFAALAVVLPLLSIAALVLRIEVRRLRRATPPPAVSEPETPTALIPCITSARWPRERAVDDTDVQYVVRPTYDPDATRHLPSQGGRRW